MDEKKRYAWLEMYSTKNNTMIYDDLHVTEPFNEFFEGVLKISPSLNIKMFYITSLHIIGLLTIQRRIQRAMARKEPITERENGILNLRTSELFWPVTENIPKAFSFALVPELSVPKEFYLDLEEILSEIVKLKKMNNFSQIEYAQYKILVRALTNEEVRNRYSFFKDRFSYQVLQPVFKMFMRMKKNVIAESYYRTYEMAYFLNLYYKERFFNNPQPIAMCDIDFLVETEGGRKDGMTLGPDSSEDYEKRVIDRKFVLIMHALINKFMKQANISKKVEIYTVNILQIFLQKEQLLGYFKDFSAEVLIIGFTYIALKVHKKYLPIQKIHEIYRTLGFIRPFYIEENRRLRITIEEVIKNLVVKTYNILLPSILKNLTLKPTTTPKSERVAEESPSIKYVLSPLPGRMSKIIPVPTTSKKILFQEKEAEEIL
ncbi:uncharacterized protein NESG_00951 [Nematocida ausubeli]|uniref:Uncharacterized protein n=1 Tax=Nematocida ausubeli (strain ATCC PRA-371 / ERTm2) TaxID=1913371 RepID=H8Z968_NEMA1|nr:uncharacterized protein NESG_00951 [Nematocida ausubeli]EHY66499.1 hypothetical protein NERG_00139 [Nematocida ausubeli]KFG26795.1 hypothetical protein NESG_00951 [Nematocida ausubeli]